MIAPGTIIADRYRVERSVGQGGMQEVVAAIDQLLGIRVALKTPLPGQALVRFRNSAVFAARVNHHNVAKTYDYFEIGGVPYLIEEFVDGETLEAGLLDRTTYIDPHTAARVLHCLAKGVAASHRAGVVHRDLKPSNVMVGGGFNLDVVKVTDFGIASLTEEVFEEAAKSGDLTRSTSGTVRGALPYMSPEMMFRKAGDHPGPPADVWSLGALAFRTLTGSYPFGVGFEAAANVKTHTRAPWPNFMTANPQFAPLCRELQSLVEYCLVYDSKKRPTADQLVERCEGLCCFVAPRSQGRVQNLLYNGEYGFISDDAGGIVFFNSDSIYGPRRAAPGTRVCFSACFGTPHPRAHPVVILTR
jgi:serine/threonine protein kinase, bacterial